jgi:uncharacterized protein (DUF427 family)
MGRSLLGKWLIGCEDAIELAPLSVDNTEPIPTRRRRKMPKASWNGKVIAQSEPFETVEGNFYFPPSALKKEFFVESPTHTTCSWKGEASYYHVEVDGVRNKDAAWYYPEPKDAAKKIKGYVAFWKGIEVT